MELTLEEIVVPMEANSPQRVAEPVVENLQQPLVEMESVRSQTLRSRRNRVDPLRLVNKCRGKAVGSAIVQASTRIYQWDARPFGTNGSSN